MAEMTRRKCAFCPDNEPCAIMYIAEERNIAVHQNCLLFSSGFVELEEENPEDNDKRFDVASVLSEIKRGKRLLCNVCRKRGATIGCEVKNCRKSYHYFCALRGDASIETDQGLYRLFCPSHIQAKRSSFYDENKEKAMPLVLTESSSTTIKMVTSVMAEMTRRKCAFCPDNEPCAIMYIAEERNIAVHQNCLLFSSGFVELEKLNPVDLDKQFDMASVVSEMKRGKQLLCNVCHKRGATIGCEVKNCCKSYHYFCALRGDASIETDQGLYRLFCPDHIPIRRSSFYDENKEKAMPLVLTESSSTTIKMNGETVEEENMEVSSEKRDQPKERIEFLKKCKQAGLLNEIFEEMLNTLRLAQEKLMDDNTSEAEYEKTVISLFDCGLFENILRAARSGTEGKIQELMNTRKGLDAQIEVLRDLKEIVFPVSKDNTSSSMS